MSIVDALRALLRNAETMQKAARIDADKEYAQGYVDAARKALRLAEGAQ